MLEFLARQILRQALKHAGKTAIGDDIEELNGPEAYADRIKRDFHLSEYADAQALYDGDRAYWEQYYRPLPAPDWKSEIVRDSAAAAGVPSRNNVFEYGFPELGSSQPRIGQLMSPNGSTQRVVGFNTPQTQTAGLPANETQAIVENRPARYLGRRVAGEPTVFDTGAPPLPFAPSLAPLSSDDVPHDPAGDEQDRLWFLHGWR
jgi:hypothetical protein